MDHHSPDASGPKVDPDDKNTTGGDEPSFDDLMTEVAALGEHAADYAAVKVDAMRARLRGLALGLIVRVCGILIAVITISTLSLYTLRGVRGALEALTGRAWVADLLTGTLGLGAAGAGLWLHQARAARIARERMVLKHERRKSRKHQPDRNTPGGPTRYAA